MTGPERIWIKPCHPCTEPDDYYVQHPDYTGFASIGYIRADLHDEVVKALREALEDAEYDLLQWLECSAELVKAGFNMDGTADVVAKARAALARTGEG